MTGTVDERLNGIMACADRTISNGDTMYTGNTEHYFAVAASALRAVLVSIDAAGNPPPRSILDFGCGHGRVMRALRAAFPRAELLASDVDAEGVSRCVSAFGARPVACSTDVERLEKVQDVDLIWCGSVLTHLGADHWPPLLRYFAAALAPGGLAVVTTHGRAVAWKLEHETDYLLGPEARAEVLASYRSRGFGYHDYPGTKGFGVSLSSPAWVVREILALRTLRLTGYVEAGWDSHQDVVSFVRDCEGPVSRLTTTRPAGGA